MSVEYLATHRRQLQHWRSWAQMMGNTYAIETAHMSTHEMFKKDISVETCDMCTCSLYGIMSSQMCMYTCAQDAEGAVDGAPRCRAARSYMLQNGMMHLWQHE